MCGISGIYQIKDVNNKLKQAVDFMNQSQINRGPDDSGIFINEKRGIGLGHQRLSIIDLSKKGKQPMGFNDIWITYNGEIYNFLELKKDLKEKGCKFATKTDTEVILALYLEYGEMSFAMLRGMFAFGLWDGKKQKLFLVKDRYGIKPLYYYSDKEKLIFASTVKAITKSGLVSVKNNPQALIGFLLFGSVPLPMTTVRDVFAVPAGHYLVRNADGQQKIIQYYDPLVFYQHKSAENQHESAPIEIRQLLEESVNLHLISDAPLGIFLSGGLDSSALAALAAQIIRNQHKSTKIGVNQRLTTLSVVFKEKEFSEKKYQDLVVKKIGSEHREIKIT
ncbi:MAG TPA: asparagine synthase (glutamine-hydrolyzing) [Candidatus Wolfebacteria bacterium]|nr:asparagine synthase (glutamine-hydrolyzing) [Candidatus Wolfebacteria bacterium]